MTPHKQRQWPDSLKEGSFAPQCYAQDSDPYGSSARDDNRKNKSDRWRAESVALTVVTCVSGEEEKWRRAVEHPGSQPVVLFWQG